MSAELVAFQTPTPAIRETRARRRHAEARARLIAAVNDARPDRRTIAGCLEDYERATERHTAALERRTRQAARALRLLLGAEPSEPRVAEALTAAYGHANERRRNPGGLSDYEQRLVEAYRRSDGVGRQALHRIADALVHDADRYVTTYLAEKRDEPKPKGRG